MKQRKEKDNNYCIYARKSMESEDRQVLSIPSQTDVYYREQYNGLVQEQVRLEQKVHELEQSAESWLEPARRAVSFVKLAKEEFLAGTASQKRAILQIVGLNPTLKDGKLLISAKKPFQLLLERSSCSVWWAIEDSNL